MDGRRLPRTTRRQMKAGVAERQTRTPQARVGESPWGFKSLRRHSDGTVRPERVAVWSVRARTDGRGHAPISHVVVDAVNARRVEGDALDRVAVGVLCNVTRQVNDARLGIDGDREWARLPVRSEARSHVGGDRGVIAWDHGRSAHASRCSNQRRDRQGRDTATRPCSTSAVCSHRFHRPLSDRMTVYDEAARTIDRTSAHVVLPGRSGSAGTAPRETGTRRRCTRAGCSRRRRASRSRRAAIVVVNYGGLAVVDPVSGRRRRCRHPRLSSNPGRSRSPTAAPPPVSGGRTPSSSSGGRLARCRGRRRHGKRSRRAPSTPGR
jgi:hypothetical protein